MRPKDVSLLREVIEDPNYFKIRFLHYRVLALECAKDFYVAENHSQQSLAYKLYVKFNKKANWYERKIYDGKDPEAFAPFYLK